MPAYEATVKYLVNKDPIEGKFGPYHDVKLTVDTDNGEQDINVYADVDQVDWVDDLFELKKGDVVDIVAEKKNGKWKYYLAHWKDESSDQPFGGDDKPERPARREARPARREAAPARPARRAEAEPKQRVAKAKVHAVATFPEDVEALMLTIESHASIVERIWSSLDREFAADEDLVIKPTDENLKSMTLSIYINARDAGWL